MQTLKSFKLIGLLILASILGLAIFWPARVEENILLQALVVTPVFFSIFLAFSISERLARLDKIRENDSDERSSLVLLNDMSILAGQEVHLKVNSYIDDYLMATLDYKIWDYHKTYPYYDKLAKYVFALQHKDVGDRLSNLIEKIFAAREQTVGLIADRLSKMEWTIYAILGSGVVIPFLLFNTGSFLSICLVLLVTVSVLLMLFFLYQLDSLEWKREHRIIEPYQKAFESIGRHRYFPHGIFSDTKIQTMGGNHYRIGYFPYAYPNFQDKEIKSYDNHVKNI